MDSVSVSESETTEVVSEKDIQEIEIKDLKLLRIVGFDGKTGFGGHHNYRYLDGSNKNEDSKWKTQRRVFVRSCEIVCSKITLVIVNIYQRNYKWVDKNAKICTYFLIYR